MPGLKISLRVIATRRRVANPLVISEAAIVPVTPGRFHRFLTPTLGRIVPIGGDALIAITASTPSPPLAGCAGNKVTAVMAWGPIRLLFLPDRRSRGMMDKSALLAIWSIAFAALSLCLPKRVRAWLPVASILSAGAPGSLMSRVLT